MSVTQEDIRDVRIQIDRLGDCLTEIEEGAWNGIDNEFPDVGAPDIFKGVNDARRAFEAVSEFVSKVTA